MFFSHHYWRLHEGKVGIVGNEGLRENDDLSTFFSGVCDRLQDLLSRAIATKQHRTDLDSGSSNFA
jgi:hypothetical protein